MTVTQPDDAVITACAQLRVGCHRIGHFRGAKLHDGDRWIAAAAIRLGCPLVSHDTIFQGAPGVTLITAADP